MRFVSQEGKKWDRVFMQRKKLCLTRCNQEHGDGVVLDGPNHVHWSALSQVLESPSRNGPTMSVASSLLNC